MDIFEINVQMSSNQAETILNKIIKTLLTPTKLNEEQENVVKKPEDNVSCWIHQHWLLIANDTENVFPFPNQLGYRHNILLFTSQCGFH